MRRHSFAGSLLVAVGLCVFVGSASASPIPPAHVLASIGGGPVLLEDEKFHDLAFDFFQVTASVTEGSNQARAEIELGAGRVGGSELHGYVESHGRRVATSQSDWRDTLTVSSDTLPFGAPVDLRGHVIFDGELARSGGGIVQGNLEYRLGSLTLDTLFCDVCALKTPAAGLFSFDRSGVLHTTVGASVGFLTLMVLQAQGPINSSAKLDVSHTVRFYIDSLTEGASYQTDSGFTYFSPEDEPAVPEPHAMWMMLLGIGCYARTRHRSV